MDFVVEVPNIEQLTTAFAQAPDIALPILTKAMNAAQAILAQYTTRGIVPWDTGFLAQTFQATFADLTLTWRPTASYAPYVEFGTGLYDPEGPHLIYPKTAKVLSWDSGAGQVFAEYTVGMPGRDYMGGIVRAAQPDISAMFGVALDQIVEAIAEAGNI